MNKIITSMRKHLQKICMAVMPLVFTQCAQLNQEPAPKPVQETWQITYDDYRVLRNNLGWVLPKFFGIETPEEYKDITRSLTVIREGSKVSIKGIFAEYPDAWVKGMIKNDTLMFEPTQILEGTNGNNIYFHSGFAVSSHLHDASSITYQISFTPDSKRLFPIFITDADKTNYRWSRGPSFWLSKDDSEDSRVEFYNTWQNGRVYGTGFPKSENHMVNMVFRKISEVATENEVDDNIETK